VSIPPIFYKAAFIHADPESAKNIVKLEVFFALLGSVHVKAACETLMKLTPIVLRYLLLSFIQELSNGLQISLILVICKIVAILFS